MVAELNHPSGRLQQDKQLRHLLRLRATVGVANAYVMAQAAPRRIGLRSGSFSSQGSQCCSSRCMVAVYVWERSVQFLLAWQSMLQSTQHYGGLRLEAVNAASPRNGSQCLT